MNNPDLHASLDRRSFIKTSAIAVGSVGFWSGLSPAAPSESLSPSERPVAGYIGTGIRYHNLLEAALPYSTCAAICDVDSRHLSEAGEFHNELTQELGLARRDVDQCEDYRRILDRPDIDVVVIATPDHWHAKMAIDALRAGKDVYCEKPLTLTIEEGAQILKVLDETGGVLQVGTQQRSSENFQLASALLRDGRIGKPRRITCGVGGAPVSPSLPAVSSPKELNWDLWLGQAPLVEFRQASTVPGDDEYGSEFPYGRAHAHFRWWYEYAGGKLTDWGAHHVDIAMWALEHANAVSSEAPYTIDPIRVEHPVPFKNGMPTKDDCFNTATKFHIRVTFADGVELDIRDQAKEDLGFENGIMFQGDSGRYFVNRERFSGRPVEDLETDPLPEGSLDHIYGRRVNIDDDEGTQKNMVNFLECVKDRDTPISDVASHHRHLTVCHAANIALRLGRPLKYDPIQRTFLGDDEASSMISREQRKGYRIDA